MHGVCISRSRIRQECMGIARMKQDEEANTRIIAKEEQVKIKERNVGTKRKSPKQSPTNGE